MRILRLLLACLAVLTGCAIVPAGFESFQPVQSGRSFDLKDAVVGKQGPAEYALAAGRYVEVAENTSGTLFRGPVRCVVYQHMQGYMVQSGGVWVPKDPAGKLKLFGYAHQDAENFMDLSSALAAQRPGAVPGSTANSDASAVTLQLALANTPTSASPAQAGAAAGLAGGIVDAMVAADIERERGMPLPLLTIENSTLSQMVRGASVR